MDPLPHPNWQRWSAAIISQADFEQRREPYLRFTSYTELFEDIVGGMQLVSEGLHKFSGVTSPVDLAASARQRLWDIMDWMSLQYSAGAPVTLLQETWPYAINWAEEYAHYHKMYHQSAEARGAITPHIALRHDEYWKVALRIICCGLLTGYATEMRRVMLLLDYCNDDMGVRDGLLERLVAPFVPGRGTPPDKATRNLPYRKLFNVFDAAAEKRPALMIKYLEEWYRASRHEPYIDQHGESDFSFYGYWSREAAAVTWLLQIDDTRYRDMPFYPRDLVDFSRSLPTS